MRSFVRAVAGGLAAALLCGAATAAQTGGGRDRGRLDRDEAESRRDVLIGPGGYHEGELQGCSAESCVFESATYPRADVFFLGLSVAESDSPPAVDDYTSDGVYLRGASAVRARVLGIGSDSVVTERGSFPRRDVAWVFLAPALPGADDPPTVSSAPPPVSPGSASAPSPVPPSASQSPGPTGGARSPAPAAPGSPAARGGGAVPPAGVATAAAWRGIVRSRHTWSDGGARGERRAEVRLRLTEQARLVSDPRAPMGKPVLSIVTLEHAGSSIEEAFDGTGGAATGNAQRCVGKGRARISGGAGTLWRNLSGGDVSGAAGFTVPPEGAYLIGGVHETEPASYPIHCESGGGSEVFFAVGPFGQGVPYTPDARISAQGSRIVGRATWTEDDHQYELAWSICRQGIACPPPPEPTGSSSTPRDECAEPATETALLNLTLEQQRAVSDRLAARFSEYSRLANEAREYQSDFELALQTCDRISDLQTLLTLLVGQGPQNVQNAAGLLSVLRNILVDGDATFVVQDYVAGLLEVEHVWETVMFGLEKIGPATSPSPRERLMTCAGYNVDPVFQDAMRFVQLTERAEPLMREINELLNDLRHRDEEELLSRWQKYQDACREYAECTGRPASTCDRLPSP